MTIDLDVMEGLAKAATPGEWLNTGAKTVDDEWMVTGGEGESYGLIGCVLTEEDAAYIAAANPQAVLALIAENRAYREALKDIAHPQYGLGFNKLRGIARAALKPVEG